MFFRLIRGTIRGDRSWMERFELVRFLTEEDASLSKLMLLAGFAGVCFTAIIVIIHAAIRHAPEGDDVRMLGLFVITLTLMGTIQQHVDARVATVLQAALAKIRIRIADSLRKASLGDFEDLPPEHIRTILAENCDILTHGCREYWRILPSGVMIVCSSFYLATVNSIALLLMVATTCMIAWILFRMGQDASGESERRLASEKKFFKIFEQLILGFKELKMHAPWSNEVFHDHLSPVTHWNRDREIQAEAGYSRTEIRITTLYFGLLAVIIFFLMPLTSLTAMEALVIATVITFVLDRLQVITEGIPRVARANVAILALQQLETDLKHIAEKGVSHTESSPCTVNGFKSIVLEGVHFAYPSDLSRDMKGFSIGPINFQIRPGETIFIRGGNGSGKSSLLKVMTGLYVPRAGRILLDGKVIEQARRTHYRNLFSVVFADSHLFDRLYGLPDISTRRVGQMLETMNIATATAFKDGAFTSLDLSSGQRKRLALSTALLEDRPIYFFDEIAADQDPKFRRRIYEEIIPGLTRQGKTVIAITHDEKYFDNCDRLLVMDQGSLRAAI